MSEIVKLKEQLEEVQKTAKEYLAGWQRAKADFLNYKREVTENQHSFHESVACMFIKKILPVVDSFEAALKDSKKEEGLEHIYKQLMDILHKEHVVVIEDENIAFDPKIHESVGEIKGEKHGLVGEIVQKGYLYKGSIEILLRPAKVKITK